MARVNEKVIAIVAERQSTNGAEPRKSSETNRPFAPTAVRLEPLTPLPPAWLMCFTGRDW